MNKRFLLLIAALPLLLFSCETCYTCEYYHYCHECTITLTDTTFTDEDCFDTPFQREASIEGLEDAYGNSNVTCEESSNKVNGFDEEICGKRKEVEEDVDGWKSIGYICREE